MAQAPRDGNRIATLLGVSSSDGTTPVVLWADPTTHRLLVDLPAGTGDVTGPGSATNNAATRFDGTTGKIIQNSAVIIADTTGNISGLEQITFNGTTSGTTALKPTAAAGTTTLTMPAATDTLVGKATTDTFTNKTFDANGTGNALSNVDVADLADGTDGELITWNSSAAPATVAVGTSGQILTSNGAGAAPTFQSASGTGDVDGDTASVDKEFVRFNSTTGKIIESPNTDNSSVTATLSDNVDVTFYDATNDGNPIFSYGSSSAERLTITPTYDSGAKTLDYVEFATAAASATADKGEFRFNVDGTLIATIDDGGLEIKASGALNFGAVRILSDSTGTTTLENIDALDATTESTIESAIDTLANLTAASSLVTVGALNSGTIATGFGNIDNGGSNITSGGVLSLDVDGAAAAEGALVLGAGADASIFFDGTNLNILTDGAGASGIIFDSEDDTFEFKGSGVLLATLDGSGLNLAASDAVSFGGVNILSDSAGTMTLSNVDSLDATTESTIEAAIDTLANLTSIQGLTVTLADAAADSIFGWDDTASEYSNLTQAEVLAVIGTSSVTAKGVVELATVAETNTGTDTARAVTPNGLSSAVKSIMLSASGGKGLTTAGAAGPTQIETTTNDINYWVLEFDTTTEEHVFWNFPMPDNWDAGVVNATFYWTNAGGSSSQTVDWGIAGGSWSNDDPIDAALGTEITTTDTFLAQGDMHISPVSGNITVANAAAGEWCTFVVARKVGSDNLSGDARLISVKIEYTIDAYSE